MSDIEHGTYGGYQQHKVKGVPLTPECGCEEARNVYMRDYRASHPDLRSRARVHAKARQRALSALAGLHQADYNRLFAAELRKIKAEGS